MSKEEQLTEQQIISKYKQLRSEHTSIGAKISELDMDLNEHKY
jgi:hypothetical protein